MGIRVVGAGIPNCGGGCWHGAIIGTMHGLGSTSRPGFGSGSAEIDVCIITSLSCEIEYYLI